MMNRKALTTILLLVLVAMADLADLHLPLFAQQNVGGITGRVTDASNAVVPGVVVVTRHEQTGQERESQANQDGIYMFRHLQVGDYTLIVKLSGFKTYQRTGVRVVSGETTTVKSCWSWAASRRLSRSRAKWLRWTRYKA